VYALANQSHTLEYGMTVYHCLDHVLWSKQSKPDGSWGDPSPFAFEDDCDTLDEAHVLGGPIHGYLDRIALCSNATTGMHSRRWKVTEASGYMEYTLSGRTTIKWGKPWTAKPRICYEPSQALIDTALNKAKAIFLSKLIEANTSFQGGTFLGELKETLHQLRNPAVALRRGIDGYLRQAKKLKSKRRSRRWKTDAVADTWLEWSFGFKPLISDIEDAGNAINNLPHFGCTRIYAVADAEDFIPNKYYVANRYFAFIDAYYSHRRKHVRILRGGVRNSPSWAEYFRHFGFSPEAFVPTLWELAPWSFLVDYFVNIGDILSGWSYGRTNLGWSNTTTIFEGETSVLFVPRHDVIPSSAGGWSILPAANYVIRESQRDQYNDSYTPDLEFRIPGLGTQALNITALAQLALSSKRKT
jgi:hypothetical protein